MRNSNGFRGCNKNACGSNAGTSLPPRFPFKMNQTKGAVAQKQVSGFWPTPKLQSSNLRFRVAAFRLFFLAVSSQGSGDPVLSHLDPRGASLSAPRREVVRSQPRPCDNCFLGHGSVLGTWFYVLLLFVFFWEDGFSLKINQRKEGAIVPSVLCSQDKSPRYTGAAYLKWDAADLLCCFMWGTKPCLNRLKAE